MGQLVQSRRRAGKKGGKGEGSGLRGGRDTHYIVLLPSCHLRKCYMDIQFLRWNLPFLLDPVFL
jgi:hypothetical protein